MSFLDNSCGNPEPGSTPDKVFESVFEKMLQTFATELSSGNWSLFRTEKHIIMEMTSSFFRPLLPLQLSRDPSPELCKIQVDSVESIIVDSVNPPSEPQKHLNAW
jgi:hypothetical protein